MMRKYLALLALTGIVFFSCSTEKTKIACVGDSITEGYGLKKQSATSYPVVLNKILGNTYAVENFGRSATNVQKQADFPYWIAKEFSNVFAFEPDVIVIKLGTNDTKPHNWNAERYEKDYQAMIDTFRTIATHPKIYLCYPVPVYETTWGINDSTVTAGVIPIIDKLAAKNSLPIIDLYEGLSNQKENFPDNVHPNEAGVEKMAEIVAEELQK